MFKYIIAVMLCIVAFSVQAKPTFGPYHATMDRVIDGDTVVMTLNTEPDHYWQVSLRVAGIDTPEMHPSLKRGQPLCQIPMAQAAKAYTVAWFQGATDIQVSHVHLGAFVHRAIGDITAMKNGKLHNLSDDILASGHARKEIIGQSGKGWCQ